jgi:hypothetical protein
LAAWLERALGELTPDWSESADTAAQLGTLRPLGNSTAPNISRIDKYFDRILTPGIDMDCVYGWSALIAI